MDMSVLFMGVGILFCLVLFIWVIPFPLWIRAILAGVYVNIFELIFMRFKNVNPKTIIEPLIRAKQAGFILTWSALVSHQLAGGDISGVVNSLISTKSVDIDFDYAKASTLDLAGYDLKKVIDKYIKEKSVKADVNKIKILSDESLKKIIKNQQLWT